MTGTLTQQQIEAFKQVFDAFKEGEIMTLYGIQGVRSYLKKVDGFKELAAEDSPVFWYNQCSSVYDLSLVGEVKITFIDDKEGQPHSAY